MSETYRAVRRTFETFASAPLRLGYSTENGATEIVIECAGVLNILENADLSIRAEKPDGTAYAPTVTTDGTALHWMIADTDVAIAGQGKAQIVAEGENDEIIASGVACTYIDEGVSAPET